MSTLRMPNINQVALSGRLEPVMNFSLFVFCIYDTNSVSE